MVAQVNQVARFSVERIRHRHQRAIAEVRAFQSYPPEGSVILNPEMFP